MNETYRSIFFLSDSGIRLYNQVPVKVSIITTAVKLNKESLYINMIINMQTWQREENTTYITYVTTLYKIYQHGLKTWATWLSAFILDWEGSPT